MKFMKLMGIVSAILSFLLISCATTKPVAEFSNTKSFDGDFDSVWNSVMFVVNDVGLPIKVIEKESGVIQTGDISASRNDLEQISNYKYNMLETLLRANYNLKFYIYKIGDGKTKVRLNTYVEATVEDLSHEVYKKSYQSSGYIEGNFFRKIANRLSR